MEPKPSANWVVFFWCLAGAVFFYLLHLYLIYFVAVLVALAFDQPVWHGTIIGGVSPKPFGYGHDLPFMCATWILALAILYGLVRGLWVSIGKHMLEFSKEGFNSGKFPLGMSSHDASGGSVSYELGSAAHDTIELRDGSVLSGDLVPSTACKCRYGLAAIFRPSTEIS